ncbi:SpoIIE family protein phosphatase [Patescibacteria group bacterium]|nr:SpoIIE family protein phosphatase [Patescibacteria group bacterium]
MKKVRFGITAKILGAFLLVAMIPPVIIGLFEIQYNRRMMDRVVQNSDWIKTTSVTRSEQALKEQMKVNLRQLVKDKVREMELIIEKRRVRRGIPLDSLMGVVQELNIGKNGYAFLIDKQGLLVAQRNYSFYLPEQEKEGIDLSQSEDIDFRTIIKKMTEGKSDIATFIFGDQKSYLAYAPITSLGWSFAIGAPVDEIVQPAIAMGEEIVSSIAASTKEMETEIRGSRRRLEIVGFFIFGMVVLTAYLLSRTITKPIQLLSKSAERIGQGDLDYRIKLKSRDEIGLMANAFNKMTSDLQGYMENLRRTTAEKERMEKELEIGRNIQQSFLPQSIPQIEGFDLAATNMPAMEVGGDFYDFIPVAKDKLGLAIADVSGKGISAALFMALSKTLIRTSAVGNPDVASAIKQANKLILADSKSNMFITLFYAIFSPKEMSLRYVNAGHNPPILLREGSGDPILLETKGIALSVIEDIELEEGEVKLAKGDVVVLYTDGVTEAINEKEEQFGEERFIRAIKENHTLSAQDIIEKVQHEITIFTKEQPQFDDITLMVLKVGSRK